MTFCCHAELIWRMLAKTEDGGEGKTQQAVADELGWSRTNVANFARLQDIDPKAWEIVTTAVRDGLSREPGDVTDGVTAVTFSENLLRVLPPLLPDQQHELCRLLARGKDAKRVTNSRRRRTSLFRRNGIGR
jgi:hypothetical protein